MKKIHVTLRRKALKSGRISLYLDFFPAVTDPKTGETYRREFLKLYLISKPKNAVEKNANSESLRRAEFICSNRLNELNKQQIYTPFELELLEIQALGEHRLWHISRNLPIKGLVTMRKYAAFPQMAGTPCVGIPRRCGSSYNCCFPNGPGESK